MFSSMLGDKVHAFVTLIRPYNATAALLACAIGFLFPSTTKNWTDFVFALVTLLLCHSFATVLNDIIDQDVDLVNAPEKPLQVKRIMLIEAKRYTFILAILAVGLSLLHPLPQLLCTIFFLLIIYLYNCKPFQFSYKPILSVITLGFAYTCIPMLYGYMLNNNVFGIFYGKGLLFPGLVLAWLLVRISISMLKDYKDEIGDALFHKKTFYLAYGKRVTAVTSFILAIIGYTGILIVSFYMKTLSFVSLLPIFFCLLVFLPRVKLLATTEAKQANVLFHKIFFSENRFEAAYLLWLIFG